jgi:BirA family biotin operon repressor/biotin-[acetyl-CoA-carboxylase] ligase
MAIDLSRLLAATFLAGAEQHDVLPSTNDYARALPSAVPLPHLVLAAEQTAGRGRGTNSWWTGRGSLAMSLLIDPARHGIRPEHLLLVSLACAVSLVETIQGLAPGVPLGLHWPNDVFAAGRKLSGILIERLPGGRMVLGIGVNTNNTLAEAPAPLQATATTLRDLTGEACDHTEFLRALLTGLEDDLAELAHRPASIARAADGLCLQRGEELTVVTGGRTVTGTCRGIDDNGALLLAAPQGVQRIYSGALDHRPTATKALPPCGTSPPSARGCP